jgi:hypothetical protein
LDPDFDDIPNDRIDEVHSDVLDQSYQKHIKEKLAKDNLVQLEELCAIQELLEPRDVEAEEMRQHAEPDVPMPTQGLDPTVAQSRSRGQPLEIATEHPDEFFQELKSAY